MVVSENMLKDYKLKYGVDCVIVRHALANPCDTTISINDTQKIYIGFAGTLYDQSQLTSLICALRELNWMYKDKEIILRIIGNTYIFKCLFSPCNIQLYGRRNVEETKLILEESHFNFLPIPLKKEWKTFAKYSFPTKLSTYLAAGRPVLVQAPKDSAASDFCSENNIGCICSSVDINHVKKCILEMLNENDNLNYQENVGKACVKHFTKEKMNADFCQFLDI
jgi:hypothetical protein